MHDNEGAKNANESGCAVDISSPAHIDVERSIKVVDMQIVEQEKRMAGIKLKVEMDEESLRERLTKVEETVNQLNADKQKMQNFSTHFGQVHSFSGFRKTTSEFALDWALINVVQSRIGLNEVYFLIFLATLVQDTNISSTRFPFQKGFQAQTIKTTRLS